MYEYSRSEYLKALLNQKKTLNATSNSLVNPGMPQADNIAQLAALDTSFSGTTSTPTPENAEVEENDRNWWQRTWDTAQEFVSNLGEGVLSVVDGIVDLGGYVYGAISGDQEGAQEFMNYDWEAQALNVLNQIDVGTALVTGDFFTKNYWEEWEDTLSAEASRENINQLHRNSWTSEMGEGQQKYNQITQGIGSLLPSIALGIVTGGASIGVQIAAQAGLSGLSAFGNSATQALNEGAGYGEAGAYAGIQGGISAITTAATMGIGGAVASKTGSGIVGNVGRSVGEKVLSATGSKTAEVFAAKATEIALKAGTSAALAAARTATDPLIKQITYDSEALYNAYGDDEKTKQTLARAGSAATNAAITSVVASSIKETGEYLVRGSEGYYADYYSQKAASYQTKIASELNKINKGLETGKLTHEQAQVRIQRLDDYSAKVEQYGKISLDYAEKIYNKAVEKQEATMAEQRANATSYAEAHKEVKLDFGVNKDVMQRISAVAQNKSVTDSILRYANQNFSKTETGSNGNVRFIASDGSTFEYNNNNTGNLSLMVGKKAYDLTVSVKQGNMVAIPSTPKQTVDAIIALGSSNYAPQIIEVKNNIVPVVHNTTNQTQPLTISKEVATHIVKTNNEVEIKEGLNILKNSKTNEVYVKEEKGQDLIVINYVNNEGENANLQLVVAKGNEIQSLEVKPGVMKIDESFSLVEPQTTQTSTPTPSGTTILDPTEPLKPKGHEASLVKAKANWDHQRVLSLKSSNDVVKEVVSTLEHKLISGKLVSNTGKTKVKIVHETKDLGRVLFERANLAKNPKQLEAEIDKIVNQIGRTKIVVNDDGNEYEITINDIAKNSVLNELKSLVNDLILARSETSKIAKINARIDTIKETLGKEIEKLRHRFEIYKKADDLVKSIKKKIETNKMPTGYDVRVPELQIFHDLIKDFRMSQAKLGISPGSVDHLIENFKIYTEENFKDSFIGFNQDVRDIIDDFASKLDKNGKFPNRELTVEESDNFIKVLTWIKHSMDDLYSERMRQMAEKVKFAGREAEVVNKTFKNKTPTTRFGKTISKIKNGSISVPEVFAQTFGRDSEFYKIAVVDVTKAQGQRYLVIETHSEQMKKDLTKFGLKESTMLDKKISFELVDTNGNKVKFKLTYDQLGDLYAHSLIDENKKVIIGNGIEIYNTKTEKYDSFKLTEDEFNTILAKIPTSVKQYVDYVVIERFSGDYRQYFIDKYEERTGIKIPLEGKYYTMNRGELQDTGLANMDARHKTFIGIHSAVSKKRVNNNRPMRIIGVTTKQREYIFDVSQYEMDAAMQNYNALLNKKITTTNGKVTTINNLLEQSVFNWAEYKKQYAMAMMGVRYDDSDGTINNIFSNFVMTPILFNFSSTAKNLLSGFKIYRVVGHKAASLGGIKGIANIFRWKKIDGKLKAKSGYYAKRYSNKDVIRANTLRNKLSWIHKVGGAGMQFLDNFVVLTKGWSAAQLKAKYLYGYEIGTQENEDAAIPILEDIMLRTQSNAELLYMSKGRAGGFKGGVAKDLFYVFAADAQQTLQFINEDTVGVHNSRLREKEYREQAEDPNNDDETKDFYRKKADEEHKFNNFKEVNKRRFSAALMLLMTGASAAFINQLNKWLKGKDDIGSFDKEEMLEDAIFEATLGWIPIVSTLANAYFNDTDPSMLTIEGWKQCVDAFDKVTKAIESGDETDIMRAVNSAATLVSNFFGVPLKNIKDYFFGTWINFDKKSGIQARSFVEGYSQTYVAQLYNEALEKNQVYRAEAYLSTMMYFYKNGKAQDETLHELVRLARVDEKVLPRNYMTEFTDDNDVTWALDDKQIQQFTQVYQQVNSSVNGLLNVTEYKSLSDEEKAKVIKRLYDAYYYYAKAHLFNQEKADNTLATVLLYSNGKMNINKYVSILNVISNIKETDDETRKDLVLKYINSLKGYSKQEKLLIMRMAGYKVSGENEKLLSVYLKKNGFNNKQIDIFLGKETDEKKKKKQKNLLKSENNLLSKKG